MIWALVGWGLGVVVLARGLGRWVWGWRPEGSSPSFDDLRAWALLWLLVVVFWPVSVVAWLWTRARRRLELAGADGVVGRLVGLTPSIRRRRRERTEELERELGL